MDPTAQQPIPNPTPPSNTPLSTIRIQNPSPSQIPSSSPSPEPPQKKFNILKLGLLEVIFVFLLLTVVFATLQFFHIFNVASLLPHHTPVTFVTPTPTTQSVVPIHPTPLVLDTTTLIPLKAYLSTKLKPEFIPTTSLDNLAVQQASNTLHSQWTQNNATMNLEAIYDLDASATIPAMFSVNIINTSLAKTLASPLNSSTATTLVNTYFLSFSPHTSWKCTTLHQGSQCELSEKNSTSIVGYEAVFYSSSGTIPANISLTQCTIPTRSSLYANITSCLPSQSLP